MIDRLRAAHTGLRCSTSGRSINAETGACIRLPGAPSSSFLT
jgi:hypothetical protein